MRQMSKFKLFISNFLTYGIGSVVSKIIPLVMLPIITRLLPNTSYFGISDLVGTISEFGCALAIMGMYDAMYRMFFEKDDLHFKKKICSTVIFFNIITSIIISSLIVIFKDAIAISVLGNKKYGYLVCLAAVSTLVGATNGIVSAPTRMQNKSKVFVIMNTLTPVISYSISVPLILKGYYIIALPLAGCISAVMSEFVFIVINHSWFSFKFFDFKLLKPLLKIALPLLPNFLIYWIFNSSDKIMITNLIDTSATGIYSSGAKLGQVSQVIYTAFAGGWQFFAFSTMKEKDQVKSNSKVFEYLGLVTYICSLFTFALCKPVYKILFDGDFEKGYIVAPYLFLAPLLQMLFQVAANQFLVIKKTWPNFFILLIGACCNVVLNLALIPKMGIEGAAIATLVGYMISDIVCVIVLYKLKLMKVSIKFVFATMIMLFFICTWSIFYEKSFWCFFILCFVISAIFIIVYKKELEEITK